ncbi:hypothetical protein BWQ96_08779 [Gracilariopsis chorda]|uniref:SnoaL-like domain-containing protein n=1 Tax=Gracilariopsis chorda TaxID=448386 RepID=A0A2V3IHE2_9FLOR|nr:hypothetical protein BWQ96_08779 [Gracilariopsis chorda]|eukprot:PXF41497.1 hypothetical protein BWQ96_08779 [Gracilariopsis chorda]
MSLSQTIAFATLLCVTYFSIASATYYRPSRPTYCSYEKPLPIQVTEEHIEALNDCNVKRLVQLRTDDFIFYFPRGDVSKGRAGALTTFTNLCKPFPEGFRGLKLTIKEAFLVGNTYNVRWVISAPFFEDYHGADAYVTRGFKMAAQVTTFDSEELNFTRSA